MAAVPRKDVHDNVPWTDVVRFVRQLGHDLRNHLNAAELQAAYISELTGDAELKTEIKRLREIISGLGTTLQKITASLSPVKPELMPYRATDFVEDLRKKVANDLSKENAAINWDTQLDDVTLNIDPQLLTQAFVELLKNAFQHGRTEGAIVAAVKIDNGRFVFALHEPKKGFDLPTDNWGCAPLGNASQGHYGLGLNRARAIVEVHNGELQARYDSKSSALITTIILPVSKK